MHLDYIQSICVIVNQIIKALMKTPAHLFAIALVITLIGCQEPADSPNLTDTRWLLQSVEIADGSDFHVDQDRIFSISFIEPDTIRGQWDCNTYQGSYTLPDINALDIITIGGTKVGCGLPHENNIYFDLIASYQYNLIDGNLRLINIATDMVYVYTSGE
jgi:heat shock protein HslJ